MPDPLLLPLARPARAQMLDKLSFHTDWRAQAEHGGYYQAIAAGLYKARGIELDLRPGGPSLNIGQMLLAGRVDMIMSNSFEAFTYVREQAPFFTIAAIFQKDPQVLIAHPGTGFDSFEKMKGRPLLISNGSRSTFWPYLRKKYGLSDAQLRPYNFNMAPFLADPQAIQQGFLTSEVYSIAKALGKQPRGAADRRRGLQRLPDHHRHLAEARDREEGADPALRRRHARGLGAVPQGRPGDRRGQRADQEGQSGADRRPHPSCRQGAERPRHRPVGRCARPAASAP